MINPPKTKFHDQHDPRRSARKAPRREQTSTQVPSFGVGAWAWGDRLFWGYESWDAGKGGKGGMGFDACIKGGVKLFDTAEIYGPGRSEELLGQFLRESGAKDVQVATKFAAFPWKLDRSEVWGRSASEPVLVLVLLEWVVKACKGSLERLGMDSIDIYQIHFPSVWKNEVFWDGLGDCYEQGLVKAVGVSNYGSSAVRAISKTLGERGIPLTSNQIQYSLLYRYPELNGMKATCDELGVKILAYSPLALGALTGKWSDQAPSGPRGAIAEKLMKDDQWQGLLDAMKDVAGQHGPETTLSQVAIAWCIAKGTTPIPGVRNVRQAEERPDRCGAAPKVGMRQHWSCFVGSAPMSWLQQGVEDYFVCLGSILEVANIVVEIDWIDFQSI
ncbi:unnamed protein product [Durusdinium trenchii]|uniref:NADP-dependent oxidoreductase domain-containing protein n=1 Tax=Durusdinium trenchii TaxID=1381693 RepID=A0ABP0IIS7_9DINO